MITFFLVAGALLVTALLFVLPPLIGKRVRIGKVSHGQTNLSIYRDQIRELESDLVNGTLDENQFELSKREIEKRALDEVSDEQSGISSAGPKWSLATAVAILIPLATISTYLMVGTPVALEPNSEVTQARDGAHDLSPQKLAKMIEALNGRLRDNPDDVEGWVILAKTTQSVGRYEESVRAYREIVKRVPPDAQLFADFADTLAMANGRTLVGEPQKLIEQALQLDPQNIKALALGGTVAFQQKEFSKAAQLWQKVLALVPPEAEFAQRIRESVSEAEQRAGGRVTAPQTIAGAPSENSSRGASSAAVASASLSGKVAIDPAVAKSVMPGETVFIFAKAASGPKMPLAILRMTVKDLPASFELTDAMAMAPGMSISKFPELVVGARVSRSGNAISQPGDWESELVPVRAGAKGISLIISRIVR